MTLLCRADQLADPGSKGVTLGEGADRLDVVVVKTAGTVRAFINSCPHQFIPLNIFPDYVFTSDKKHLLCSGHGALFEPGTGLCVKGPCQGDSLTPLNIEERGGEIYLSEARSPAEIARERKSKRNW